jgi:hypothetical protein
MKEIEFTLPSSGKKVKMRESTGIDELTARRKFIGKSEDEKINQPWELIAKCIVSIDGEKNPPKGYEDLLKFTTKDLNVLLLAFNNINVPNEQELKDLRDFFPGLRKT